MPVLRRVFAYIPLLALSSLSSAALLDRGIYTTDTQSGLDWLDLIVTSGVSYNEAEARNPGWRYATNSEVEDLFNQIFVGYYNTSGAGYSDNEDGYDDQSEDAQLWIDLLGPSSRYSDIYGWNYGYYVDERGLLSLIGVLCTDCSKFSRVFGLDPAYAFDRSRTATDGARGILLVRASAVPIPAAAWLFGSALIGLIGVNRSK